MGAPLMSACENGKKQLQVHVKRPIEKEKRKKNTEQWKYKLMQNNNFSIIWHSFVNIKPIAPVFGTCDLQVVLGNSKMSCDINT